MKTGRQQNHGSLALALALMLGAAPLTWAGGWSVIQYSEAKVLLQENTTDMDLGFHFKADGEGWDWSRLVTPRDPATG